MNERVKGLKDFCIGTRALLLLCSVLCFSLFLSPKLSEPVLEGLIYSSRVILPVTLPFFIVADYYTAIGTPERIRPLAAVFSRLFGIPPQGLGCFVIGSVAGFPTGAKLASSLYFSGQLDKGSAIRLSALSNNPSIAFLVGVVGASMGNERLGIRLFFCILLSALITALIYRRKASPSYSTMKNCNNAKLKNPVAVVKEAALSSLYLTAFVALFYAITHAITDAISSVVTGLLLASMLEVCSAIEMLSASGFHLRIAILCFTLGFGGLSVAMQSSLFFKESGLPLFPYIKIKLTQGVVCAILSFILI